MVWREVFEEANRGLISQIRRNNLISSKTHSSKLTDCCEPERESSPATKVHVSDDDENKKKLLHSTHCICCDPNTHTHTQQQSNTSNSLVSICFVRARQRLRQPSKPTTTQAHCNHAIIRSIRKLSQSVSNWSQPASFGAGS